MLQSAKVAGTAKGPFQHEATYVYIAHTYIPYTVAISHFFAGSVPFVDLVVPGIRDWVETHQYCGKIGLHKQI